MNKIAVFIAVSLDGFIARKNGDIEWLDTSGHGEVDKGEDFGYKSFMSSVDALVMGRITYEKVLSFDEWYYGAKSVFVLSNKPVEIPTKLRETVFSMSGSPHEIVEKLEKLGHHRLYIDGGKTIQGFLKANLIDEMTITTIPILLGSGIPLFGPLSNDIKLRCLKARLYKNGFVQSTYQVAK